jgi:hypothetical protein
MLSVCGLCAACHPASSDFDEFFGASFAAILPVLGEAFAELGAHPAALRASFGMMCGSEAMCDTGVPEAGDRCEAEAEAFSPDFTLEFDACLVDGEARTLCFERARSAHEVSAEQASNAEACRSSLGRCPDLASDACDALEALQAPALVESVLRCTDVACGEASGCMIGALLEGLPKAPKECGLAPILGRPVAQR